MKPSERIAELAKKHQHKCDGICNEHELITLELVASIKAIIEYLDEPKKDPTIL